VIFDDAADLAAFSSRLNTLVEKRFEGSQSELARALGLTPGAISRACRAQNAPSFSLLSRLAKLPGVSVQNLLSGVGDEPKHEPSVSLPLVRRPLTANANLDDQERFRVLPPDWRALATETRYVIELQGARKTMDLVQGDLMLVETAKGAWLGREELWIGKPVVIASPHGQTAELATLTTNRSSNVQTRFAAKSLGGAEVPCHFLGDDVDSDWSAGEKAYGKQFPKIDLGDDGDSRSNIGETKPWTVIAVVLHVWRSYGR
jgi:transcriptional regulator with XRE-family HTH domain